jgi:glycosyltransferase involved in cell wall biosynthesis
MEGGLRIQGKEKSGREQEPLVSIITVVLNGQKHIEQTIKSVLEQTYPNIEYLVMDGGSTDGTLDILKKYNDKIALWQSEPDKGIYFAMNKGIALAKGSLIGILNADDFYLPDAIMKIVENDHVQKADIYYGDMLLITENSSAPEIRMKPDILQMDEKPSIFHPTCFVKREVYEKAGLFDTQFKISSDYEFLLRCIRKNFKFFYVPEAITTFRSGGISGSCASNVEGYKVMKMHKTGHHKAVIWRGIKCYVKTFLKKALHLK